MYKRDDGVVAPESFMGYDMIQMQRKYDMEISMLTYRIDQLEYMIRKWQLDQDNN